MFGDKPLWCLLVWTTAIVILSSAAQPNDTPEIPRSALFDEGITWISQIVSANFSKAERECFKKQNVLYADDSHCYDLLTRGPCDRSQWLVYDKDEFVNNGHLRTECAERPCQLPHEYLGEDARRCDESQMKFQLRGELDSKNCKFVGKNAFGERKCLCRGFHFRLMNSDDEACYLPYERGSCDVGSVVTPMYDLEQVDAAECRLDPCFSDASSARRIPIRSEDGDTKCYELGTQGPCVVNSILGLGFYSGLPYYYPICSRPLPSFVKIGSGKHSVKN